MWRETRELSVDMVEQIAKLDAPMSCQFSHLRPLTCHAELTDVDARSQAMALGEVFFATLNL